MNNGKYANRKGIATKAMVMILAVMLIVGISVGGTLAWLTSKTETVTNTFSPSDIKITLTETWNTDTNDDGTKDAWVGKLVPGAEIAKNPVVAVDGEKTDVDCYLFVKFEEKNNPSTYLDYTSTLTEENGWKHGDGTVIPATVWYREVKVDATIKEWHLLDGDKVTVKNTVTKDNMADAAKAELVYTAYAIQTEGFNTAAAAWSEIGK